MKKKIYLKVIAGDWKSASRDKRELRAARELGFKTVIIAATKESKKILYENTDEFDVVCIPTRKYGHGRIRSVLGRLVSILIFIRQTGYIKADVVSGHNYSGWMIGYLAYGKKAKYIYDSHEYELYQQKDRNVLEFYLIKIIEKFVLKHSDINIMVTESIAEAVKKIYRLDNRPLVIRNIPEKSGSVFADKRKNRKEFLTHLNISGDGFIIMYHGGFAPGRGIEEAVRAITRLEDVGLVLMGYALDESYKRSLIDLMEGLGCADRVYFKNPVPFPKLYDNVSAADAGIVLIQNTCASFWYSLPNKLLENIQALTPVIGSDFPEIGKIIEGYRIGIKIRPDDVDALVGAVNNMRNDKEKYFFYMKNLKIAKEELCWENESIKLKQAIKELEIIEKEKDNIK